MELHAGGGDRDPFEGDGILDDEHSCLEPDADSQAGDDLVPEPLAQRAVDSQGGDHAGSDGEEDHARQDEGVVVTDDGDEAARADGGDDDRDEHGQELDAGFDGGVAFDGLEVEGLSSVSTCLPLNQGESGGQEDTYTNNKPN